jgi:hypothetical protein
MDSTIPNICPGRKTHARDMVASDNSVTWSLRIQEI